MVVPGQSQLTSLQQDLGMLHKTYLALEVSLEEECSHDVAMEEAKDACLHFDGFGRSLCNKEDGVHSEEGLACVISG